MDEQNNCNHCWHHHRGPFMMLLHDGEILQTCCKCHNTRTIHFDHALDESAKETNAYARY